MCAPPASHHHSCVISIYHAIWKSFISANEACVPNCLVHNKCYISLSILFLFCFRNHHRENVLKYPKSRTCHWQTGKQPQLAKFRKTSFPGTFSKKEEESETMTWIFCQASPEPPCIFCKHAANHHIPSPSHASCCFPHTYSLKKKKGSQKSDLFGGEINELGQKDICGCWRGVVGTFVCFVCLLVDILLNHNHVPGQVIITGK